MLIDMKIGFAITGSFCTHSAALSTVEDLVKKGADVYPIVSSIVNETGTRFFESGVVVSELERITGHKVISTIEKAEPIGPRKLLDVVCVAPCTGNTLGKMAGGITDTAVLMACKAHLRNQRPVVLAVSTNDGLGASAKNIGHLMTCKNIYFVPFRQDDPINKPMSLVARFDLVPATIECALEGKQIQPILT
ncbi:MAG: dipicolinate synthase subunit B [Ruminococcaceae bacterium]|nr:dipicolinate synthase subunit B [Oscillospiraceae bacterium]